MINPRFEMVYKDVPQHGTNIIQLFLNHVSADRRLILPGQDLFENIATFNERLLYSPGIIPQNFRPRHSTSRKPHTRSKYLSRCQPTGKRSVRQPQLDSPVSHHTI